MPSELKVNKLSPYTGSTLTLGDSGDTIAITSGASLTGFTSTGIDDNATNTAVTIDSSQNVGIGTTSPSTALDVDGTVTATQFVGGGLNAYRNLIINGDMSLAQRGTSVTNLQNSPAYLIDRFSYRRIGTWTTAEYTMSQSTDVPTGQGFANSAKIEVTTAEASVPADAGSQFAQFLEGQMLQYLKKGTANAESLTLSFWVKSNKTGTYIVQIFDVDNSRSISKSYTVDASNTWEKKTITFEGDTTGALDNDSSASFQIYWFLAAGTDYTSGTLATSWESFVQANRAVGQVNLADSASNEWYITGIQLEAGTSASDFEFLPYDVNLQRCQRYFIADFQGSAGQAFNATTGVISLNHPVSMRATASVSQKTGVSITIDIIGGAQNATGLSLAGSGSSLQTTAILVTGMSGRTTNQPIIIANTGTELSAEI